jgi:hypothetical protein
MNEDHQMDSEILVPDAARTIEGLRDTGYTFNTAVADVVDNSIAAGATHIDVALTQVPGGSLEIVIADNGHGMDHEALKDGMRLGSRPRADPYSLGKFGLGLKTASFSIARELSVVTRTAPTDLGRAARWDLDFVSRTNEWRVLYPDPTDFELGLIDAVGPGAAGTAVIWRKVDRLFERQYQNPEGGWAKKALDSAVKDLRWHLALTYTRFLDEKSEHRVSITVNEEPLAAWDPFGLALYSEPLLDKPVKVKIDGREAPLTVRAYLLPHKSTLSEEQQQQANISNDLQGFYVFRHNRLLTYGTWLGLFSSEPHYSYLRVDLSFDHELDDALKLDIKKSRIEFRHELEAYLRKELGGPRNQARLHYDQKEREGITKLSGGLHDRANKVLERTAGSLVSTTTSQQGDNLVLVKNRQGATVIEVPTDKEDAPFIVPVPTLPDGVLWETHFGHNRPSVQLNTGHPFYQRAYFPLRDFPLANQALDFFLWSLVEAQLAAISEREIDHMDAVRLVVSQILRKLALQELPEPDLDASAGAEGSGDAA